MVPAARPPLTPNRLRMAYIGGSLIDATRKAQTEALLGLRLHHGYGLSESGPPPRGPSAIRRPASITAGWPIPGVDVEVQDAAGRCAAARRARRSLHPRTERDEGLLPRPGADPRRDR